ncbi:2-hydroxyacid dehydrogenase [Sphingobium sp. CR28]|uniref:2-hydroxyacid dehydrogenase n=1 Tax=Sphingobium sp. CR28 TaxID=3400272 RepID=UPI003FEF9C21
MTDRPDLISISSPPEQLAAPLAERFTVHVDSGPRTTRAIVGAGTMRLSAQDMERYPALEIVAINGVGYDGVDIAAAEARGIRVTTTTGVLTDDVADLAIGLMLAVERRIAVNDRAARAGTWQVPLSTRATGRRVGIFVMGQIGLAIARRAEPFAGEILYSARSQKAVPWTFKADIESLAEASDVLIIIAPGGPETRAIVNARVLEKLGKDGVLVNVARGSLVDEAALVRALEAGTIAGAGLDVFEDEPNIPDALKTMDQVVLSPHQGSATVACRQQMADLVLANLDAHFAGKPLLTPLV